MAESDDKTVRAENLGLKTSKKEETGFAGTMEMSRKTFVGKIQATQHAFLEIMDEMERKIELKEDEVIIGRIPECGIELLVENVSRKHASIMYSNEEYQIQDLGSTNGIYVNGIKVERCILRDHDLIEIGGVKILFCEEKIRQEP